MGFLSGLNQQIFGGSKSTSGSQGISGWSLLPKEIQGTYTDYADALRKLIPNASEYYKPIGVTPDETAAFDAIRKGFAPTTESLGRDISMFTNPFEDFVIGDVNRAAGSDYSILKQDLGAAGQFGSNRQRLGANDIEQTRLGTIGKLRQGEYNTALSSVLNNLIPQRQQDAAGLLGIGDFLRKLNLQTSSSPVTGLQEIAKALGILPTSGGSQESSQGESNSYSGNLGKYLFGGGSSAAAAGG